MSVSDIAVIVAVVAAVAGLAWWFFGPKPAAEARLAGGVQEIRVRVRGGYSPSRIHARPGVPVRLVFDRQESGDCTSRVVFPDLGVSAELPAFAETLVDLPAQAPGEYGFACGMNMIHGLLAVDGQGSTGSASQAAGAAAVASRHELAGAASGAGGDVVSALPAGPAAPQAATITVEGGYRPGRVLARAGMPLRLEFDRREDGACSAHVVFPALGVEADLAPHERTVVDLPALAEGRYEFACGMGMLHGVIEARANMRAEGIDGASASRPAPVIVPPVVRDSVARPRPARDEDAEAAERRAGRSDRAGAVRRAGVGLFPPGLAARAAAEHSASVA
jgi:Cu+-exporting ATPase